MSEKEQAPDLAAQAEQIAWKKLEDEGLPGKEAPYKDRRDQELHEFGKLILRASDTGLDKAKQRVLETLGLRNETGGKGIMPANKEERELRWHAKDAADKRYGEIINPSQPTTQELSEAPETTPVDVALERPTNYVEVQRLPYSDAEAIRRARQADQEMIDRISKPV